MKPHLELTDDRGSHDDPNLKSSVAKCGRSNIRSLWGRLQAGSRDWSSCQGPILFLKSATIWNTTNLSLLLKPPNNKPSTFSQALTIPDTCTQKSYQDVRSRTTVSVHKVHRTLHEVSRLNNIIENKWTGMSRLKQYQTKPTVTAQAETTADGSQNLKHIWSWSQTATIRMRNIQKDSWK